MFLVTTALEPQKLFAFTVIVPLVNELLKLTVIELVEDDPEILDDNVHVYDVAPLTEATLYTTPVWFLHAPEKPVMAAGAAGADPDRTIVADAVPEQL